MVFKLDLYIICLWILSMIIGCVVTNARYVGQTCGIKGVSESNM